MTGSEMAVHQLDIIRYWSISAMQIIEEGGVEYVLEDFEFLEARVAQARAALEEAMEKGGESHNNGE